MDFEVRIPESEIMDTKEAMAHLKNNAVLNKKGENNLVQMLNQFFPNNKWKRILDLGSGTGTATLHLARDFAEAEVVGIDATPKCIDCALWFKNKVEEHIDPLNNLKYVLAKLPNRSVEKPHSFDLIVSRSTLHHFQNPISFWMTVKYYSKANTQVYIHDLKRPSHYGEIEHLVEGAADNMKEMYLNSFRASYRCNEVRAQLESVGLSNYIVRESANHFFVVCNPVGN